MLPLPYNFVRRFMGSFLISCPFPRPFFFISPPQVLGAAESRGVLKKISDMLEVILKRIDNLSKLENASSSDARRLDELSSAISRYARFPSLGPAPCVSHTRCYLSAACYDIIQVLCSPLHAHTHPHDGLWSCLLSESLVSSAVPVIFKRSALT